MTIGCVSDMETRQISEVEYVSVSRHRVITDQTCSRDGKNNHFAITKYLGKASDRTSHKSHQIDSWMLLNQRIAILGTGIDLGSP